VRQRGFAGLIILVLIAFAIAGYFAYKYYALNSAVIKIPLIPQATPLISPTPIATTAHTCINDQLKISLTLPNTDWSCDSSNLTLNLKSNVFTIVIGGLGRGPWCGEDPDPEHLCQTRTLDLSDKFPLTIYSYSGEDKEIFNELRQFSTTPWISIKYSAMETKTLTSDQKSELLQLLNSIKAIQ
jgi:hypothetical protein